MTDVEPDATDQIEGKADELLKTGKVAFSHYMGALLLIPDSDPVFGRIQAFNVVDGQQRLPSSFGPRLKRPLHRQMVSWIGWVSSKTRQQKAQHG